MDMVDLLKMGAQIFINSDKSGDAGSRLDAGSLVSAFSGLAGGASSEGFDLSSLLSRMNSGELGDIAKSWLGDGQNAPVSPEQVTNLFGADNISHFASNLGLSNEEAAGGLSDALPSMMDKASSGGSLLDSIGGVSGAIGLASKLFGK
jgi:uncharacterized protein YidB (DUF937 family)